MSRASKAIKCPLVALPYIFIGLLIWLPWAWLFDDDESSISELLGFLFDQFKKDLT